MSQFCPQCGIENVNAAKFCKSCGFNLAEATAKVNKKNSNKQTATYQAESQSDEKTYSGNAALIIGVVIIVSLAYSYIDYPGLQLRLMMQSAEHGNSFAQYELAMMYIEGEEGLDKSNHDAAKWLTKAASNGHEKAKIMLCSNNTLTSDMALEIDKDTLRHICQSQGVESKSR